MPQEAIEISFGQEINPFQYGITEVFSGAHPQSKLAKTALKSTGRIHLVRTGLVIARLIPYLSHPHASRLEIHLLYDQPRNQMELTCMATREETSLTVLNDMLSHQWNKNRAEFRDFEDRANAWWEVNRRIEKGSPANPFVFEGLSPQAPNDLTISFMPSTHRI